jgi:hypothetical protein
MLSAVQFRVAEILDQPSTGTLRPSAPPPYLSYCTALIVLGVAMATPCCVLVRGRGETGEERVKKERLVGGV